MLISLIKQINHAKFLLKIYTYVLIGTIMTISQDRVKPSPRPDSWKLNEIFATGIVIGTYLALITVLFYWIIVDTAFFEVQRSYSLNYMSFPEMGSKFYS